MRSALITFLVRSRSAARRRARFRAQNGRIVFARAGGSDPEPSLVAVDPSTGSRTGARSRRRARVLADGAKLAYVRNRAVYVAAADGTGAAAVGPGDFPAWSPDGGVSSSPVATGSLMQLSFSGSTTARPYS